jgi:hypothetical protein
MTAMKVVGPFEGKCLQRGGNIANACKPGAHAPGFYLINDTVKAFDG